MNARQLSEYELDALATGQMPTAEQAELLATSEAARAALEDRQRGFAAFPELDERLVLADVRRRLAEPIKSSFSWKQIVFGAPAALFATACLALVFMVQKQTASQELRNNDNVRPKQAAALRVQRFAGAVRFEIDLPARHAVAIVGVKPNGDVYRAWPQAAAMANREPGLSQVLEGAFALDDATGHETFHLVLCATHTPQATCALRPGSQELVCEAPCALAARSVMVKQRR